MNAEEVRKSAKNDPVGPLKPVVVSIDDDP